MLLLICGSTIRCASIPKFGCGDKIENLQSLSDRFDALVTEKFDLTCMIVRLTTFVPLRCFINITPDRADEAADQIAPQPDCHAVSIPSRKAACESMPKHLLS